MSKHFPLRIELAAPAKAKLVALSDKRGMTQIVMMSRLTEWYAGQSESIQAVIMGRYPPEIERDVARLLLKAME